MKLYTDGSCLGNPGFGGWGAICVDGEDREIFRVSGGSVQSTNNIMEMTAVIMGLERHDGSPIEVHTDSKYVMDGITKWIHGWKKKGWKTSAGGGVKNKDLWMELDERVTGSVTFKWVKAHNGDKWNEAADMLAKRNAELVKEA
jgi:ribonuclease HI